MIRNYKFKCEGSAKDYQTWTTEGTFRGELGDAFTAALRQSFEQLTQGKAVFGKPGVSCQGPYDISRIEIVKVKDN